MKPQMYGDMNAFVEKLKSMGFAEVRYVETAEAIFGSKQRAAMMMLGDSAMIVGRNNAGISRDAIHMKRAYHSGGWTALLSL